MRDSSHQESLPDGIKSPVKEVANTNNATPDPTATVYSFSKPQFKEIIRIIANTTQRLEYDSSTGALDQGQPPANAEGDAKEKAEGREFEIVNEVFV